jgi:hypothetical protein
MEADGYDPTIMRSFLALLPKTRNEQGFTKTVRACVHGTLFMLLDCKLKSVVLAAGTEAQHSLPVPLIARCRHV